MSEKMLSDSNLFILLRKCNLELNMTATEATEVTESTESTERGLGAEKTSLCTLVLCGRKLQKTDMV